MANIKIRTHTGAVPDLVRPRPQDDGQFGLWVSDRDKFSAYVHADVLDFIKEMVTRLHQTRRLVY